MTRIESIHYFARQLERSAAELRDTVNYRDALCRWKELRVMIAHLSIEVELLENVIKLQYQKETGIRAVGNLWKKLNTRIRSKKMTSPEQLSFFVDMDEKNL